MHMRKNALLLALGLAACHGDVTEASDGSTGGSTSGSDGGGSSSGPAADSSSSGGGSGSMSAGSDSSGGSSGGSTGGSSGGNDSTSSGGSDSGSSTGGGMPCTQDSDCDDLLPCNGVETCVNDVCDPGIAVVCDDGNDCTVDSCNEADTSCSFFPSDGLCDDGLFCNGVETCDADQGCLAGDPIVCDDGVGCSDDACDEDADACAFTPDDSQCDDGTFCNGAEVCISGVGCMDAAPPDCNDLIACTQDACDEGQGQCTHTADDLACDDGVYCNGAETCEPGQGCQDGSAIDCADDGVACTVESCDEPTQSCTSTLDNTLCGGGQFCQPGGCVAGDPCSDDGDCDDGLACNGDETCDLSMGMPGVCQPGAPIVCGDAFACTIDACVEPGQCEFTPLDALCADGDPCNGVEVCNPASGCQDGPNLSCDDGVVCTIDQCIANYGCNNIAADENCDDGVFCNGAEVCDLQNDCQAAPPVTCASDGIACTTESCDETLDACVVDADDDLCPCGQTCSVLAGGCTAACNVAECAGHVYACGDCVDNDNDCDVDAADTNCFGPCSDNEEGLDGGIPGQDNAPCKHDCYFDNNSGTGNDDCFWNHECDPLEPSAPTCEYDPNANTPGTNQSCAELSQSQSNTCDTICGPLVPNGCDCFGCCDVALPGGGEVTIFLGSVDAGGDPSCTIDVVDDPLLCHPCTQVPACLNSCDGCEICFGQQDPPPGCGGNQQCEPGQDPCGQPGQDPCGPGGFCLTGCCVYG